MDMAAAARAAALSIECKKDSLRQNQDGTWKFTLTIADLPVEIAQAPMGTRYQTAFVELDDVENPVDRKIDSPGQVAKKHFEAMCGDEQFGEWVLAKHIGTANRVLTTRERAKLLMGIDSANELIDRPELWDALYQDYLNR